MGFKPTPMIVLTNYTTQVLLLFLTTELLYFYCVYGRVFDKRVKITNSLRG